MEQHWTCDECGFQEYTQALSEDEVHELHCMNCGGWDWHLEDLQKD